MKQINLSEMSVDGLVSQFAAMAREQDDAMLDDDNVKYNRLFWQMELVEAELKSRGDDQRRALMSLTTILIYRSASPRQRQRWP
jgi:hypothetical protein